MKKSPKDAAAAIMIGFNPKASNASESHDDDEEDGSDGDESEGGGGMEEQAQSLMDALDGRDAEGVVKALRKLVKGCR